MFVHWNFLKQLLFVPQKNLHVDLGVASSFKTLTFQTSCNKETFMRATWAAVTLVTFVLLLTEDASKLIILNINENQHFHSRLAIKLKLSCACYCTFALIQKF